jgi:hypothetical protein
LSIAGDGVAGAASHWADQASDLALKCRNPDLAFGCYVHMLAQENVALAARILKETEGVLREAGHIK